MELKFEVEKRNDTNRSFHTNVIVGQHVIEQYAPWLSSSHDKALRNQGQIVANMVFDLLRIKGIESIFVQPYEVTVHMDSINQPCIWWNEQIDVIVRDAFEKLYDKQMSASIKKVFVEKTSEDRREEFHTNFEVSRSYIEDFRRPLRDSSDSYLKKLGSNGEALVRSLMDLPGIICVYMEPYEVTIDIGRVFGWTERDNDGKTLENKVKEAFEQVFGHDIVFVNK